MSFLRVSLISAILFCASTSNAQNSSVFLRDFDVDEKVTDHQTLRGTVGVGVVVVHDGEIVYLQGYGDEDREANIFVDPKETRFRWASIAKTFTSAIAVRAHTGDIVDLDKHVSYYYPQYKVPNKYYVNGEKTDGQYLPTSQRHISMRRLLSHMSGIQHYSNGLSSPTPPNSRKNIVRRSTREWNGR